MGRKFLFDSELFESCFLLVAQDRSDVRAEDKNHGLGRNPQAQTLPQALLLHLVVLLFGLCGCLAVSRGDLTLEA